MTIIISDEESNLEFVFFYNPRNKRYMGFLRDPTTFIWKSFVREFWICATCTFNTPPKGHWSKGLLLEAQACVRITYDEYKLAENDQEFIDFIEEKTQEADCRSCFNLFGVDYEVAGITYHSVEPEQYCKKLHPLQGTLVKDYTRWAYD